MRLKSAILVGLLALIAAILTAAVLAVSVVVDRSAMRQVELELERAQQVFRDLRSDRERLFRSKARVVAEEPRLKAAVSTEDPSRRTIIDVARTMHETVGSDLFLLTDGQGTLVVDVLAPELEGQDVTHRPVVKRALEEGSASEIWADGSRAYQVTAQRLAFGAQVVGVLVLGHAIGPRLAERLRDQTGSSAVVMIGDRVVAASPFGDREVSEEELARVAARVRESGGERVEVELSGVRYLGAGGDFADYRGERSLYYAVLADLDRALAPGRRVTRIIYGIAAVAMLAAVLFGLWFSRRLTRPLDRLVAVTKAVATGDLRARAEVAGVAEVEELGDAMNRMVRELEESRSSLAEKERLENELEIAARIQTSIVPRSFDLPGLEIAARMEPAGEVGGDYFDAFAVEEGGWIGIGDVAGHGLDSGLVMLMAQTSVSTLVEALPETSPRGLFIALNRVIFENVSRRMKGDRHMTMSLLRYYRDGRLVIAGAHLDILILRAETGACEVVPSQGTWLGLTTDIEHVLTETEVRLEDGDAVVLYTDGVTEAADAGGELFGFERLRETVESAAASAPEAMADRITGAVRDWTAEQLDDVSVLILRYCREAAAR